MIDSHCHLDSKEFQDDLEEVLSRLREKEMRAALSCGTDLASSEENVELARRFPEIYAAVGIHPHEAYQIDESTPDRLRLLCKNKKVVAVGETGLDYFYNFSLPEVQRKSLALHIRIAREAGLPLTIHCRNAEEDLIRILKEEKAPEAGGVIHCFTGKRETALSCLELGFSLGVSGIITFKNGGELGKIFAEIPLEKLLVETDSPYLAPVPHRGKRNEPSFVEHTVARLAELKSLPVEEVKARTAENARILFKIGKTRP